MSQQIVLKQKSKRIKHWYRKLEDCVNAYANAALEVIEKYPNDYLNLSFEGDMNSPYWGRISSKYGFDGVKVLSPSSYPLYWLIYNQYDGKYYYIDDISGYLDDMSFGQIVVDWQWRWNKPLHKKTEARGEKLEYLTFGIYRLREFASEFYEFTILDHINKSVNPLGYRHKKQIDGILIRFRDEKNQVRYILQYTDESAYERRQWSDAYLLELPEPVETVEEALEILKPEGFRGNREIWAQIKRQGEWYFVPVPDLSVPPYVLIKKNAFLPAEDEQRAHHQVSELIKMDDKIYARGTVRHINKEHYVLKLKDQWHLVTKGRVVHTEPIRKYEYRRRWFVD